MYIDYNILSNIELQKHGELQNTAQKQESKAINTKKKWNTLESKVERPNTMRAKVVDKYIK
jgi:hypothetical protein